MLAEEGNECGVWHLPVHYRGDGSGLRRPPGSSHSGLVLIACTVYQEVYLPNLNIDAL